jgi:hypothetical protein
VQYPYTSDNERLIPALLKDNRSEAQKILDSGTASLSEVMRLAERHMVDVIILKQLARLRLNGAAASSFIPEYAERLREAAALHVRLRYELKQAARTLRQAGIDVLHIKGFAIDRSPLRRMNDIDLLIRARDLDSAFSTLEQAGYRYMGSGVMSEKEIRKPFSTLEWNNQFQFESPTSPVSVEIHTNLFERDRIRLENLDTLLDGVALFWEGRVWDEELACFIPSAEASLALLCMHSTTKRSPAHNTYVLRHAYDIWNICQQAFNGERFRFLCRQWEIQYYAYTALRLSALSLGIEQLDEAASALEPALTSRQRSLSDLHLKCFRGLGHASFLYRKIYTLRMPTAIGGGLRKALAWYRRAVFPPLYRQEQLFGIRRSSPAIYLTYLYGPFLRIYELIRHAPNRR